MEGSRWTARKEAKDTHERRWMCCVGTRRDKWTTSGFCRPTRELSSMGVIKKDRNRQHVCVLHSSAYLLQRNAESSCHCLIGFHVNHGLGFFNRSTCSSGRSRLSLGIVGSHCSLVNVIQFDCLRTRNILMGIQNNCTVLEYTISTVQYKIWSREYEPSLSLDE